MRAYKSSRPVSSAATFFAVLGAFAFTVCLFLGLFWWYGRDYALVSPDKTYYFLVRDCEDTTASAVAGQIYLQGGAGYLLETAGESAVVLSCYFSERDAERVKTTMDEKGVETRVLVLSTEDFSLDGSAAALKSAVSANINTAESCARILYDAANGLERTELSQEEARAAVRGVVKSLKGLRIGNGENFAQWNYALTQAERRGTEIAEGILFAKDLRYLQVQLCLDIVRADEYFG